MRKVIVNESMSLDGVVQAPGEPRRGHERRLRARRLAPRATSTTSMKWMVDNVTGAGGYLLGRRTYEVFAAHWPNASEEEQVLAHR